MTPASGTAKAVPAEHPVGDAPPPRGQEGQLQETPHLHDGPHLQGVARPAHLQAGVQVQGLHLQVVVIGGLLWSGLRSLCNMPGIGRAIERIG